MTAPAATISAILAAFPADPVADVLATVAEGAAKSGCARWVALTNAETDAEDLFGRPLTAAEATALEACIRAHLNAEAARCPLCDEPSDGAPSLLCADANHPGYRGPTIEQRMRRRPLPR